MEEAPLLAGSINQGSGDYGTRNESCQHYPEEHTPRSRRLSYSVTDDSCNVEEGMFLQSEVSWDSLFCRVLEFILFLTQVYIKYESLFFEAGVMFSHLCSARFLSVLSDKHTIVCFDWVSCSTGHLL